MKGENAILSTGAASRPFFLFNVYAGVTNKCMPGHKVERFLKAEAAFETLMAKMTPGGQA